MLRQVYYETIRFALHYSVLGSRSKVCKLRNPIGLHLLDGVGKIARVGPGTTAQTYYYLEQEHYRVGIKSLPWFASLCGVWRSIIVGILQYWLGYRGGKLTYSSLPVYYLQCTA